MSDTIATPYRDRLARAISEAIRHLADVRGESLSETIAHVAQELEVDDRTLRRYMDNKTKPLARVIYPLARLAGVRPDLFLNPPEPPPPPPPVPPEYEYPLASYLVDVAADAAAEGARRHRSRQAPPAAPAPRP